MAHPEPVRIALMGAGLIGREHAALIAAHPRFALSFVSSREFDGQRVSDHVPQYRGDLRYGALGPDQLAALGAGTAAQEGR